LNWKAMMTKKMSSKTIVFISDVGISGSQSKKAIEYYLGNYANDAEIINANINSKYSKEKYYRFENAMESIQFYDNISQASRVVLFAPLMTSTYKEEIAKTFPKGRMLEFLADKCINDNSWYYEHSLLDVTDKQLFEELVKDTALLKSIFKIDETVNNGVNNGAKYSDYISSIENLQERNLVLRRGSLPKKHFYIFSLPSRANDLSLFDFKKDWSS